MSATLPAKETTQVFPESPPKSSKGMGTSPIKEDVQFEEELVNPAEPTDISVGEASLPESKGFLNTLRLDKLIKKPIKLVIVIVGLIIAVIIAVMTSVVAWFLIPVISLAAWHSVGDVVTQFDEVSDAATFESFIKKYKHGLTRPPIYVDDKGKESKGSSCDVWNVNRPKMYIKGYEVYGVNTEVDLLKKSKGIRFLERTCRKFKVDEEKRKKIKSKMRRAKMRGKKRSRLSKLVRRRMKKK